MTANTLMNLKALSLLLGIAVICGAVGRALGARTRGGLGVSITVGFVGALLGPLIGRQLGLAEPLLLNIGRPFPVVSSIAGAALFVSLLHLVPTRNLARE